MNKQKIIVTGAAGFIGSNLCLELERRGYDVIAIDNFSTGVLLNLKNFKGQIINRDIRDYGYIWKLLNLNRIKVVYHMVAVTDTRCSDNTLIADINLSAFQQLQKYCKIFNVRLVYASSAAVYGNKKPPMRESDKTNPLNPYGASKLFMENYAKGHNSIGLRYFNVFGNNEFHKDTYANMVTQMYNQAKKEGVVRLFKFGNQTRDQVYIKDVVEATIQAGESDYCGVLNIGSGREVSFNDIYLIWKEIFNKKGIDVKVQYIDNPYLFFQHRTLADISLAKEKIGYYPKFKNINKAIKDYLRWLKNESSILR